MHRLWRAEICVGRELEKTKLDEPTRQKLERQNFWPQAKHAKLHPWLTPDFKHGTLDKSWFTSEGELSFFVLNASLRATVMYMYVCMKTMQ